MAHRVCDFVHDLRLEDAPAAAVHAARRCLLDTLGVLAAGTRTETGRLLYGHAAAIHPAGDSGARLAFDGRRVSAPAAAMAAAGACDSLDAHDGHRLCKGHVGASAVPAMLAFADARPGARLGELLARILVAYEVATRAGIALHRLAPQYHTSGAWNGLAAAAIGARSLGLDAARTQAALGAAAFYGPRGLMMPVVERPSMLKDGSQMGAAAGVTAALLARDGFHAGATELIEHTDAAELWSDLGRHWRVTEHYLKPYPICRWAQPAVEAAARLRPQVPARDIAAIRIATFTEAVRLAGHAPANGDEAQYAIAFPVAAMLRHGRLGADEIDGPALREPATLDLAARVELVVEPRFEALFPGERWCEMTIETTAGRAVSSGPTASRGDPESALSDAEVVDKLYGLTAPVLDGARAGRIAGAVLSGERDAPGGELIADVLAPAGAAGGGDAAATA